MMSNPLDKSQEPLTTEDVERLKEMAKSGKLAEYGIRWIQLRNSDGTVEEPIHIPKEFEPVAKQAVLKALEKIRSDSSV